MIELRTNRQQVIWRPMAGLVDTLLAGPTPDVGAHQGTQLLHSRPSPEKVSAA